MRSISSVTDDLYQVTCSLSEVEAKLLRLNLLRQELLERQQALRNDLNQLQLKHGSVRDFHVSERMKMNLLEEVIDV